MRDKAKLKAKVELHRVTECTTLELLNQLVATHKEKEKLGKKIPFMIGGQVLGFVTNLRVEGDKLFGEIDADVPVESEVCVHCIEEQRAVYSVSIEQQFDEDE